MNFMNFMNFHEIRGKVENGPAAAHRAQRLLFPMVFIGSGGRPGPKVENPLKRVISTHFHPFA